MKIRQQIEQHNTKSFQLNLKETSQLNNEQNIKQEYNKHSNVEKRRSSSGSKAINKYNNNHIYETQNSQLLNILFLNQSSISLEKQGNQSNSNENSRQGNSHSQILYKQENQLPQQKSSYLNNSSNKKFTRLMHKDSINSVKFLNELSKINSDSKSLTDSLDQFMKEIQIGQLNGQNFVQKVVYKYIRQQEERSFDSTIHEIQETLNSPTIRSKQFKGFKAYQQFCHKQSESQNNQQFQQEQQDQILYDSKQGYSQQSLTLSKLQKINPNLKQKLIRRISLPNHTNILEISKPNIKRTDSNQYFLQTQDKSNNKSNFLSRDETSRELKQQIQKNQQQEQQQQQQKITQS